MQEVCSSMDPQLGPQIKSESPINPLQQQQQQVLVQTKLGPNCDKRMDAYWMSGAGAGGGGVGVTAAGIGPTETGFINSQPSMAEFLTHLNPESPKMVGQQGYGVVPNDSMDGVPEYPWMKEKKTARKNSNQGEFHLYLILIITISGNRNKVPASAFDWNTIISHLIGDKRVCVLKLI